MRDSKRVLNTPLRAGTVFSGLSSLLPWIRHWPQVFPTIRWTVVLVTESEGNTKPKCPEDTEHGIPGFLFFYDNTREVHKEARGWLRSQLVERDKYMTNEAWRTVMF